MENEALRTVLLDTLEAYEDREVRFPNNESIKDLIINLRLALEALDAKEGIEA